MPPIFKNLLYERKDYVTRITINREGARNALSEEVFRELKEAFLDFSYDTASGVAVLTGAGDKAFAAGGDLKAFKDQTTRNPQYGLKICSEFIQTGYAMRSSGKPIIARVNGDTIGGGFELLLFCDLAVAAEHARFIGGEAFVGAIPIGATQLTTITVGDKRARWLLLTDDMIDAKTALDWGLVNKVVPYNKLDEEVDALCRRLLNKYPWALRFAKTQLNVWHDLVSHTFLSGRDFWSLHVATTRELLDGATAFMEKRPTSCMEMRADAAEGKLPEYHWGPPTRNCPKCHAVNLPEYMDYCGKCGHKLG